MGKTPPPPQRLVGQGRSLLLQELSFSIEKKTQRVLGGLTGGFVGRFCGGFLGLAGGFRRGRAPADFLFSAGGFPADFLRRILFCILRPKNHRKIYHFDGGVLADFPPQAESQTGSEQTPSSALMEPSLKLEPGLSAHFYCHV